MKPDPVTFSASRFGTDVIMSIRPEHARRIYSGKKKFELRKITPKSVPRRIFLYETNGNSFISGFLVIDGVVSGTPSELWREIGKRATPKIRFDRYFESRSLGYGFKVAFAIKFEPPISEEQIRKLVPSFQVPQNFLYLDRLPALAAMLTQRAFLAALRVSMGRLSLAPLAKANTKFFVDLVEKNVPPSYAGTEAVYAEEILSDVASGGQLNGIFTSRKRVIQIQSDGALAGFSVLTEKVGGSVKTGPTVLLKKFRGKGLGVALRNQIHDLARALGFRKVYCTAPLDRQDVLGYLLAAGYRIEAHLKTRYHKGHDELVLSWVADSCVGQPHHYVRELHSLSSIQRLRTVDPDVGSLLQSQCSLTMEGLGPAWGMRQIKAAAAQAKGRAKDNRPRVVFVGRGLGPINAILCAPKRGGSVKLVLASRTGHTRSNRELIRYAASALYKDPSVRNLYANVPVQDQDLYDALTAEGFQAEGLLRRPYGCDCDYVVMASEKSNG